MRNTGFPMTEYPFIHLLTRGKHNQQLYYYRQLPEIILLGINIISMSCVAYLGSRNRPS